MKTTTPAWVTWICPKCDHRVDIRPTAEVGYCDHRDRRPHLPPAKMQRQPRPSTSRTSFG